MKKFKNATMNDIFAGIIVALLLLLWINARKREIAIMLSLGISDISLRATAHNHKVPRLVYPVYA